jgi:hypothetical protein
MTKRSKFKLGEVARDHLSHLTKCWKSCLGLAESLIARKSDDPMDEDVRRVTVFELSQHLFQKHALEFAVFIELATSPPRKKRRSR